MQYVFLAAVLGILGSFTILLFVAVRKQPLSMITRALLFFLVLVPVPFLFFGFLASFEPSADWGWHLGYGVFLLWSLITAARLCWVKPRLSAGHQLTRTRSQYSKQPTTPLNWNKKVFWRSWIPKVNELQEMQTNKIVRDVQRRFRLSKLFWITIRIFSTKFCFC